MTGLEIEMWHLFIGPNIKQQAGSKKDNTVIVLFKCI